MKINQYVEGTETQLSATFTVGGILTDPTTVTCKVKDPTGNITTYTNQISHPSTGTYSINIFLNISGTWYYRWEGTGAATVAAENQLRVKTSQF